MAKCKISVAIPTYNRPDYLKKCLTSVLSQNFTDYNVVVLDNNSTDDIGAVVNSFNDPRVTHVRHKINVGQLHNWNSAFRLNSGKYLNIFHDDDVMLPDFLGKSIEILDKCPSAAFSCCVSRNIDPDGSPLESEGMTGRPTGLINGIDFLHNIAAGESLPIPPSSVVFRAATIEKSGDFDSPHNRHMIDRNIIYRLARNFDIAFLNKELMQLRCHPDQLREIYLQSEEKNVEQKLAINSEHIDVVAYLLTTDRAKDPSYLDWLQSRLRAMNSLNSQCIQTLLPDFYWSWDERIEMTIRELEEQIPVNTKVVVVDDNQWGANSLLNCYQVVPYLESDGYCGGDPANSQDAIRELNRHRKSGAKYLIFGWPAFWWFECYIEMRRYLFSRFQCVLRNSRIVVFNLQK